MQRIILFIYIIMMSFEAIGQAKLLIKVQDSLQNPISQAHIIVNDMKNFTNTDGICAFHLTNGRYLLKITHISFENYSQQISITQDTLIAVTLHERKELLQEVVITAREKKTFTSTSVIDRKAMQHLQPSSFSDLVSLLPGKNVSAPVLNQANTLRLRETGIASNDYATSTLGVAFAIDDIPINSNANMQKIVGAEMILNSGYADAKRNTTRAGVDMRTITTDDIEKVEITRGIAPVSHGDLSSGLVQITRKKGKTQWQARVKSDGFSKLFYLGKGFHFAKHQLNLNLSFDYLDAKADPRNSLENYQRYTASVRAEKTFKTVNPVVWNINLDYTDTADKEKRDADTGFDRYDSYKSGYRNLRLSNLLSMQWKGSFIHRLSFKNSLSQSFDRIEQTRWVQITSAKALPTKQEAGEHYGIFIQPNYISELVIDGKPLDIFTDLSVNASHSFLNFRSEFLAGVNHSYSKNNGDGQVFDITQPPSPDAYIAPRAFKYIPAMQNIAFYLQGQLSTDILNTHLALRAGFRANSFVNLPNHSISEKPFVDPRINLMINFPKITFRNQKQLSINLTTGWGKQRKLPTQEMLFPQDIYRLFTQLNYYHNYKPYRQVHLKTYIFPQLNEHLQPAVNTKKEVRLGFDYDFHSLYITYFNELMTSGFRKMTDFKKVTYKRYNTEHLNHNALTAAPLVDDLPYVTEKALVLSGTETNGSAIYKQGVEFQYSGKRFEGINTRFTLNGAWLRTRYYNALPVLRFAEKDILNGIQYYNLGVYDEQDNYDKQHLQTSLIADTYLPKLGLTTSLRFDFNWFSLDEVIPVNGIPTHYIDVDGNRHPYAQTQQQDAVLQWLVRPVSVNLVTRTPMSMNAHLKISKTFYKHFTTSMYVNNLFSFYKDFYVNNQKINRRGLISPYFGMEMNINF